MTFPKEPGMSFEERREAAALARREAIEARVGGNRGDRPAMRRASEDPDAPRQRVRLPISEAPAVRAKVEGDSTGCYVSGMASVTERGYDMWDEFGAYTEEVDARAFDATLATGPSVEFTLNHNRSGGAPMAATWNGTLSLDVVREGDTTGLSYDANVDASRSDVGDMVKALDRGDLREASFKFGIVRGQWSPDFTTYRILEVDLNGGDVTAANFGANPSATSSLRAPVASPKTGRSVVRDGFDRAQVL